MLVSLMMSSKMKEFYLCQGYKNVTRVTVAQVRNHLAKKWKLFYLSAINWIIAKSWKLAPNSSLLNICLGESCHHLKMLHRFNIWYQRSVTGKKMASLFLYYLISLYYFFLGGGRKVYTSCQVIWNTSNHCLDITILKDMRIRGKSSKSRPHILSPTTTHFKSQHYIYLTFTRYFTYLQTKNIQLYIIKALYTTA